MNKKDIIFAIVCGLLVAWITLDFLGKYGLVFLIIFPVLSILGLKITDLIGRYKSIVRQFGRFFLVGAFADVIDIKIFQLLFLFLPFSIFLKTISFLVATFVKFGLNKFWAFEKHEKDGIKKEAAQFFFITMIGLALNVGSFYYFSEIMGEQFGLPSHLWKELSIIFSALVAAIWNFLGYKFVVFKK